MANKYYTGLYTGFISALIAEMVVGSVIMGNYKANQTIERKLRDATLVDINNDSKTDICVNDRYYVQTTKGNFIPAEEYFDEVRGVK